MKKIGVLVFVAVFFTACLPQEVVEPKLVLKASQSNRGDAVFSLIVPDNNYGQLEDIHVYTWTQDGQINTNRVLIDFYFNNISTSAIVDSAFLSLYFNYSSSYDRVVNNEEINGAEDMIIQKVTSDWHENTVTWNKQPKTTETNQVTVTKKNSETANYENIDVTNLVQDIINSEKRYGIMIRHKNEVPYNVVFFASKEHPDKNLHPKLTIYWREE